MPFSLGSQQGLSLDRLAQLLCVVLEYPSFLGHASVNDIHLNIPARSRNYVFLCERLGCCTIRFFAFIPCHTIATEEFACTFSCHDTWTITTKCSCTRNPFENRTEASLPFPLSFHVCVLNPCDNWDKKQMKFAQNLQSNPDISNPRFPEPSDNSNQLSFPLYLLHSNIVILTPISRIPDCSKLPQTRTNSRLPWEKFLEKLPSITRTFKTN